MKRHWSEVGAPRAPKKRQGRNRVLPVVKEEAAAEDIDERRDAERAAAVEGATEASEVQGDNGRGDNEGRAADVAAAACKECGGVVEPICRKCDSSMEAMAREVLDRIGTEFVENVKTDRSFAFEEHAKSLMLNQGLLVASRVSTLDSISKIVFAIHTMIGAPKKKTENSEAKPLERLAAWLNGEDVEGFPVDVMSKTEEPEEADASQGSELSPA